MGAGLFGPHPAFRAARDRVIGSVLRTGSGGLAAWVLTAAASGLAEAASALGASAAVGPVPSVSQAASTRALETNKAKRVTVATLRLLNITTFIRRHSGH